MRKNYMGKLAYLLKLVERTKKKMTKKKKRLKRQPEKAFDNEIPILDIMINQ